MKILLAFDFDHTIIDDNSDTYINQLIPGGKVPKNLKRISNWTMFMQSIFTLLHEENIRKDQILACLNTIPLAPHMKEFLELIPQEYVDCIIISDSNMVFIDSILRHHDIRGIFSDIYTNPACFEDSGLLRIKMYHEQDWCHLSAINLCKGHILRSHVEEKQRCGVEYAYIGYVGDGTNDYCPSMCLNQHDGIFARRGYKLLSTIKNMKSKGQDTAANVYPWKNALEIQTVMNRWGDNLKSGSAIVPNPRLLHKRSTSLNKIVG